MDVSSISPPAPVAPVDSSGPKPVQASADNSNAYQPPPKAPLPPGQGTRVDQLA